MGAWGAGPFENDDAADWAAEFDGVDGPTGIAIVRSALSSALDAEYVEAPEGSVAVAAAQVVAWLIQPETVEGSAYNETVCAWLGTQAPLSDASLSDAARRALLRVQSPVSELNELWSEADDADWSKEIERIMAQLSVR